jgi:methionyl aminopeptidase
MGRSRSLSFLTRTTTGTLFHQPPLIQHFLNDEEGVMEPGMVFTIEPILTQGSQEYVTAPDGWTILTKDGGRAAQFEHTLLITETGHQVLT